MQKPVADNETDDIHCHSQMVGLGGTGINCSYVAYL